MPLDPRPSPLYLISMTKVLIIGAGHAGGTAAALLRQYGHEGPIVLAGEEPAAPYQRPPLSKAWLKGEADLEALLLRPEVLAALDRFVTELKSEHGATDTATRVVLRRVDGFPRQVPAAKPR